MTTYYVKNGGSDGADGLSDGNAWETMSKVDATAFGSSDIVNFKRGSTWQWTGNLELLDGVTYQAYDSGAKPIIEGSDLITSWAEVGQNTFKQSEDVTTTWGNLRLDLTADQIAAPDGETTADLVESNTNGNVSRLSQNLSVPGSDTVYTITAFAKKGTADYVHIHNWGGTGGQDTAVFNIDAGTVTTDSGMDSTSIEDVGGGWFRIRATFTRLSTHTSNEFHLGPATAGGSTNSNIGDNIYLWGMKREIGSAPTAYVKTLTTNQPTVSDIYAVDVSYTGFASEMLWEDGTKGSRQTTLAGITTAGDFWHDDANDLLFYISSDNADPDTHTINFGTDNRCCTVFTGDDVTVSDIVFRYAPRTGILYGSSGAQTGHVYSGVEVLGCNELGMQFPSGATASEVDIDDCDFSENTDVGCSLGDVRGSSVTNSRFNDNDDSGLVIAGAAVSNGNVIRDNTCDNNGESGLVVNSGTPNGGELVESNTCTNNARLTADRQGIAVFTANAIIRYNLCYGNDTSGNPGSGINIDINSDNVAVYYNLCYENGGAGIAARGDNDSTGHSIYNNTCYANRFGIQVYGTNVDDIEIKNNIMANNTVLQLRDLGASGGGSTGVDIDNNFYQFIGSGEITWDGVGYDDVAAFNSAEGFEANGADGDPLFVDAGANNFQLQVGSPTINAGVDVGLSQDYAGNPIAGLPDMGAYEFSSSSPSSGGSKGIRGLSFSRMLG